MTELLTQRKRSALDASREKKARLDEISFKKEEEEKGGGYSKDGAQICKMDSDMEGTQSDMKKEDEERPTDETDEKADGGYSDFAMKMMARMGHTKGSGLGKKGQGRVDIIEASNQRGRRGLGLTMKGLEASSNEKWNEEEKVMIRQEPDWIPTIAESRIPRLTDLESWLILGERKETIDDEIEFCSENIVAGILKNKNVFNELGGSSKEFLSARTRANPYETIRGALFMNRAAMKMAEMDASFDFMLTSPQDERGKPAVSPDQLLYFADLCAGPGGFSEYVLWRKKWRSKGFGFTIKAEWANDFKTQDFIAGTPETFDCHYGVGGYEGDGDIFKHENMVEFHEYVLANTHGKGVHFAMADGGFSVEGQENIQEILSKQLYLCQFVCALSVVRTGGHFVCKLFDLFTCFSMGLVYLMYKSFEGVSIFKPVTSRPANSERYLVCKSLKAGIEPIIEHLYDVNKRINNLKGSNIDIREVVSLSEMRADEGFVSYMLGSNDMIGARQILGLQKLATYVRNTTLVGPSQKAVREQCLEAWNIPDELRFAKQKNDPDQLFADLFSEDPVSWMKRSNNSNLSLETIKQKLSNLADHKFMFTAGERFYLLSLGHGHMYKWNPSTHSSGVVWRKLEGGCVALPRSSLLDVEMVPELRGEARGQRKVMAVHILDAIRLGEEYIGDKPLSERLKLIGSFVEALSKPCRGDLIKVRLKQSWSLREVPTVLASLEERVMKSSKREVKLCTNIDREAYYAPDGLVFLRSVKEPWHVQFSRTNQRFYFFNETTSESTYEPVRESIADFRYCVSARHHWRWRDDDITTFCGGSVAGELPGDYMTATQLCDYVKSKTPPS